MKKRMLSGLVLSSFFFASLGAYQKPCIRGKYYYNDTQDTRQHFLDILSILKANIKKIFQYGACDNSRWFEHANPPVRSQEPVITWIGHSSFLIQIGNINILTDPVFGNIPLHKRKSPVGLTPEQLPPIDYVIISHNHRDHTDTPSLYRIQAQHDPVFLVPEQVNIPGINKQKIIEKTWGESITKNDVTFTFLPAYHWSGTGPRDMRKSLWGSWMITYNNHTIYFAGDSAYGKHFQDIAALWPTIDVALLPIAPGEPHEHTKYTHMNAQEAVQAFLDLKAHTFIPMHWGTFRLGPDPFEYPIAMLKKAWESSADKLDQKELAILKFGGHWALTN
ncbi:MAG: MBL fold metallo-hydrolase [Hydrogenophaga sp.]|nr:MBL fold metallo-hydrolase [Hydrogenophaga sp.]